MNGSSSINTWQSLQIYAGKFEYIQERKVHEGIYGSVYHSLTDSKHDFLWQIAARRLIFKEVL